jgi:hypothetical protein
MTDAPDIRYARSGDIDIAYTVTAQKSELLASRTVKDLVTGSGIAFADRGPHALKGVPEEWQLYAVA